jgi:hypothetical protein
MTKQIQLANHKDTFKTSFLLIETIFSVVVFSLLLINITNVLLTNSLFVDIESFYLNVKENNLTDFKIEKKDIFLDNGEIFFKTGNKLEYAIYQKDFYFEVLR